MGREGEPITKGLGNFSIEFEERVGLDLRVLVWLSPFVWGREHLYYSGVLREIVEESFYQRG